MRRNAGAEQPDRWASQLSDYVDGELSARQARAIEEHLRTCSACAAVVDELRRVAAQAVELRVAATPAADLWPGINSRLAPRPGKATFSWLAAGTPGLFPRLAAATALIALVVAAALWLGGERRPGAEPNAATRSAAAARLATVHDEEYDRVAAALEREARASLARDPQLVEVLDDNLAALNVAIANYLDALGESPRDEHLAGRLVAVRQRKIEVLRQATTLAEGSN